MKSSESRSKICAGGEGDCPVSTGGQWVGVRNDMWHDMIGTKEEAAVATLRAMGSNKST